MEKRNLHLKVKLTVLFSIFIGAMFSQSIAPFSTLPNASSCDTTRDKIVYLSWNGSGYSNKIISPGLILRRVPAGITGLTSGYIPVASSATTITNGILFQKGRNVTIPASKYITGTDTSASTLDMQYGGVAGNAILSASKNTFSQGFIGASTVGAVMGYKNTGNYSEITSLAGFNRFRADSLIFVSRDDYFQIDISSKGNGKVLTSDANGVATWSNGFVTGTGTTNYIPLWSSTTGLGNSYLSQSGRNIKLPSYRFITGADTTKNQIDLNYSGNAETFNISNDAGADNKAWLYGSPTSLEIGYGATAGATFQSNSSAMTNAQGGHTVTVDSSSSHHTAVASMTAPAIRLNGTVAIKDANRSVGKVFTCTNATTGAGTWQTNSGGGNIIGDINDPDFSTLASVGSYYTTVGSVTTSLSGGALVLSGGAGGYTSCIYATNQNQSFENNYRRVRFTSTSNGTGLAVGFKPVTSSVAPVVLVDLSGGGTRGKLYIVSINGTTPTTLATSSGSLTYTNGDTLEITSYQTTGNNLEAFIVNRNATHQTPVRVVYNWPLTGSSMQIIDNPALYSLGGTQRIQEDVFGTNDKKNIVALWCGDSQMIGVSATSPQYAFPELTSNNFINDWAIYASGGNTVTNIISTFSNIGLYQPKYAIFSEGINEAFAGTALGTTATVGTYAYKVQQFVDSCFAYNIKPIFLYSTPIAAALSGSGTYQPLIDSYNAFLTSQYGGSFLVCDIATPLKSGGYLNTSYTSDNIHTNNAGHAVIYSTLKPLLYNYIYNKNSFSDISAKYDEANVRLGIGTVTPSYELEANKSTNGNVSIIATNTNTSTAAIAQTGCVNDQGDVFLFRLNGSGYTTSGNLVARRGLIANTASAGMMIYNTANQPIIFNVSGSGTANEVARFTSTGLQGYSSLSTTWNSVIVGSAANTIAGGASSGGTFTLSSTTHATKGKILFGTSAYDEVNNRLGIGTATPANALDVRGSGYVGRFGTTNTFLIYPDFAGTGEINAGAFMSTGGGDLSFVSAGGVTGNAVKLTYFDQTTFYSALEIANTASGYGKLILMKTGGNVGIGSASPSVKLDVNGSVNCTGGSCSSDVRWKKNITPINNSLDKILKLQGVYYDWKIKEFPNKDFENKKQVGFIAQDVEKVIPELVRTDNDGYKSLDYQKMVAFLVEAVKEQQKQIDELKKK